MYEAQGKHLKLYQLLLENGQLRSAFGTIVAYNLYDNIPENEIELIFNLLHMELFHQGRENELDSFLVSSQWQDNAPPFLFSAFAGWVGASHILSSIKKGEVPGTLVNVQHTVIRGWLCLFVS